MIPSLNTALLASLTLELAGMLALGCYWLATKHRATRPGTPIPTVPSAARLPAFAVHDNDDWASDAPYPDHILKAVREMEREQQRATSMSGKVEVVQPDRARNVRTELREALDARTDEPSVTSSTTEPAPTATPHCPRCHSSGVDTRNRARKTGRTIGGILGATGGIAVALAGAEAGAVAGIVAGPAGPVFGSLAGAVIATLFGSATGSTIGSAVGTVIDSRAWPRYECGSCGYAFSSSHQ